MPLTRLTPAEEAHFLAATAVAHAEAYLAGGDRDELGRNADQMIVKLFVSPGSSGLGGVLDPVRLLTVAMMRTALAPDVERRARWATVMTALVEMVRHESSELRRIGAAPRDPDYLR
jgi:hypothetical protein